MSESRTIPKEVSDEYGKDYGFLRASGLKYIERLSHKLWTDYNTHDPGVTMLEMLCYAITDLGYRISMPMEDILAKPGDNLAHMHEQFLSAIKVLPSCPVSADDYRQLFVRLEGVRNCWISASRRNVAARYKNLAINGKPELHYTKVGESIDPEEYREFKLQGLNTILLDYDESAFLSDEDKKKDPVVQQQLIVAKKKEIRQRVGEVYHRFRNLCEDLDTIKEVPKAGVVICGDIDIAPNADPEEVWSRIVFNIDQYLAPDISFYNLQEMQEQGKSTDQIFEGPVFSFTEPYPLPTSENPFSKKGFICKEDLVNSELRTEVRLSDIIGIIMNSEGVQLVKDIAFGLCDCNEEDMDKVRQKVAGDKWNLCISKDHKPVLCVENSVLNLWKGVMPIELKRQEAQDKLDVLRDKRNLQMESKITEDIEMPEGQYRNIGDYQTFQNDFPETYGIGSTGLSEEASPGRKAQANQLKAYLLFFEQVLANYFAQLEQVSILFGADNSIARTYFSTAIHGLKDGDKIFMDTGDWKTAVETLLLTKGLDPYIERKNMFLDHLLGRFAEQFNEYVFLMHRIYADDAEHILIRQKIAYLNDYQNVSTCRGSGFDYYNSLDSEQIPTNIPGMEKRISRLLGFNHYRRQPLANLSYQVVATGMVEIEINGVTTSVQGYGWVIKQNGAIILQSVNISFVKKMDAYEELGLASLLGCEKVHYQTTLSADQSKVSFSLINSSGTAIASHPKDYATTPGELPGGPFTLLEAAIEILTNYLLTDFRLEGMYVVENLLLRPDFDIAAEKNDLFLPVCIEADGSFCKPLDPYSFRVTVILPGYSMRLRNRYFRRYAERLIRTETPAHVLPRICFVGEDHMQEFEKTYATWLEEKQKNTTPSAGDYEQALKDLIEVLNTIFTVYEEGQLTDCDDDTAEKNPIVLGSSVLGSLEGD